VSIGLIVTELVLNSLKHAFPLATQSGQIVVAHEMAGASWKLSIADNGIGVSEDDGTAQSKRKSTGLGTSIVKALAQQLEAELKVSSGAAGTTVSITHGNLAAGVIAAHDHPAPAQAAYRRAGLEVSPIHM
jgi:two-component sensor histidine kinase